MSRMPYKSSSKPFDNTKLFVVKNQTQGRNWGIEVCVTEDSSKHGNQFSSLRPFEPVNQMTLRELYVRTSISSDSAAAELGRYLNIDETTFSSSRGRPHSTVRAADEPIHELTQGLVEEVAIDTSSTAIEYICAPEPRGGIQQRWARMRRGSVNRSQSSNEFPSTDASR
jgi:hypothetical protein